MAKYDYKPDDILHAAQDYRIVKPLGSGGMGGVYVAEHRELYRNFAIKVLHAEHWNRPDLIAMFGAEARTVARLGEPEPHPGIIEVVDLGRTKDRGRMPYMVMPYLLGETLHAALGRHASAGERMPILQTIGVVTRLCQALDHAHERGVIHRDVKPENIFLPQMAEGEGIKVLDWGISKLLQQADDPHSFIGTPAYASREQMLGEGIGALSDVYSAGVVLFRCLTGKLPFETFGMGFDELLAAIDVPAPRLGARGDFPPELERLVASALAKDPAKRPEDALAMAEELQKIGRAIRATRDPHTQVTDRVARDARGVRAARPEPVTTAGIAERTFEDPEVQKWIEAQRVRWHEQGLLGEGEGGRVVYAQARTSAEDGPVTGFEKTEETPGRIAAQTAPLPKRQVSREAATNVRGPASSPVGPAGSIRYLTNEAAARHARRNETEPMAPPRRKLVEHTVPVAPPHGGQTPTPVIVSSPRNNDERSRSKSLSSRARARWRWLFGSSTWRENGRPMLATGVGILIVALGAVSVSRMWAAPRATRSEAPASVQRAPVGEEGTVTAVAPPPAVRPPATSSPESPGGVMAGAAASSAPVTATPGLVTMTAGAPASSAIPTVLRPALTASPAPPARAPVAKPLPSAPERIKPATPPAPRPDQVGFDDLIRTL